LNFLENMERAELDDVNWDLRHDKRSPDLSCNRRIKNQD